MKKITIVTIGHFPVPAVKGGAVENIVENIIKVNEYKNNIDLCIFSCIDEEALEKSKYYRNTHFEFIKIPKFIKKIDSVLYFFAKKIFKNNMTYRFIFQRIYYIFAVSLKLKKYDYGDIILENHSSLFLSLKLFSNHKKYEDRYYFHVHNKIKSLVMSSNVIKKTRKVIGVSNYINKENHSILGNYDIDTVVLRNRVDRKNFLKSLSLDEQKKLRDKLNISEKDKIILFTGRLTEEKGIRELIQAFNLINNDNIKLLIVGSYYFKSNAKNKFEEDLRKVINNNSNIIFTGYVEYDKIFNYYYLSDIVVLPSIWDDPAPLTVIEAITSGSVLITTDSGGIKEYASECSIVLNRDEFLVDNIKNNIIELLKDNDKYELIRNKAINKSKEWTIENYYDDFYNIIENKNK